jgi:hypothetical protein
MRCGGGEVAVTPTLRPEPPFCSRAGNCCLRYLLVFFSCGFVKSQRGLLTNGAARSECAASISDIQLWSDVLACGPCGVFWSARNLHEKIRARSGELWLAPPPSELQ